MGNKQTISSTCDCTETQREKISLVKSFREIIKDIGVNSWPPDTQCASNLLCLVTTILTFSSTEM